MQVRRLTLDDLDALRVFAERTFRMAWQDTNEPVAFEQYCNAAFSAEKMLGEMLDDKAEFYFAEADGVVLAYLKLNIDKQPSRVLPGPALQLERIYVAPECQAMGIGARLLDFCEQRARQTGAQWIWLDVWTESPRSIRFYERHGFEVFGTETFMLGNDAQTDLAMRRQVKD